MAGNLVVNGSQKFEDIILAKSLKARDADLGIISLCAVQDLALLKSSTVYIFAFLLTLCWPQPG